MIKVISTVIENWYTPDIPRQIWFAYQLTGFYMIRGFTEQYFLTGYNYILENHFYFVNAPGYCFKSSLFRIFSANSSVKVLCPPCKDPSNHLLSTSSLCTFIIYRKKEIVFELNSSPNIFWAKDNPELYVFISYRLQESIKLSITKY